MRMKIAIDINNVIRDNAQQFMNVYRKYVDSTFEVPAESLTFNEMECYPFASESELQSFKYSDYPFELYGRAECCDKVLPYVLNEWMDKTLPDMDNPPEVMFFSPFEIGLTIQSTFSFLSGKSLRPREIWFPKNSIEIYDRADIVITAQPSLIDGCPEGKHVIKINKPWNSECEAEHSFDSLVELIGDHDETVAKIIEGKIG